MVGKNSKRSVGETARREFEFTDDDFKFIVSRAMSLAGISLSDQKRDLVYSRLARRLRVLKLKTFNQYCKLLEEDTEGIETGDFINAITTNLTSFYREAHHFEHLGQALKDQVKRDPKHRIRLWSAGCSAGMEPYTMALTCHRYLEKPENYDLKILATDIDTNILARAAAGQYRASDLESVPDALKKSFFSSSTEENNELMYTANQRLKSLISFKQLNLMLDWPMNGPFDVIFCRNVVIYFNRETQERLFARYASLLRPGGFLYIGHSESMKDPAGHFEYIGQTIYQKKS